MKDWKACERRIATLLGGHRVPVSGRARGYAPDVEHARLSIEVKSRKWLPVWLEDALCQAEESAKEGQVPVAVLHRMASVMPMRSWSCRSRTSLDFTGFAVVDKTEDRR